MCRPVLILSLLLAASVHAADPAPPAKPVLKITPGQVIVPTDRMRRPWGELISLDPATRTGVFRQESNDEVIHFSILPYAELLHHATFGDLQDFRVGERAIFRLHENEKGEWTWLTYIQDEMNMMNGHGEYYLVDRVDAAKREVEVTQAKLDKSFVREKGILIQMDKETRYWKKGLEAQFADIKVGDALRTKTHGVGQGKTRIAWEVFLDDESLLKFQSEQKEVHAARMKAEGSPGYVDEAGAQVAVTLFQEGSDLIGALKPGAVVRIAPAGVDRKPTAEPVTAKVVTASKSGRLGKLTLTLDQAAALKVGGIARVWGP